MHPSFARLPRLRLSRLTIGAWRYAMFSVLMALVTLAAFVPVASAMTNGQPADLVLGQPNFTSSTAATSANGMRFPRGVAVDPTTGKVFIADSDNHRILRFASFAALTNGVSAEAVLGQPDFTSATPATSASGMYSPASVAVDNTGRLWVADRVNNRVLRFDAAATKANGASADGVLGQATFASATAATSASGMRNPYGVAVDSTGRLWVTDLNNNRVLRFDAAATKANGASADGVLGQATFTTATAATSASGMSGPFGVAVDSTGRLWVTDLYNNRVLRFDAAATKANGASADGVLGQTTFTTATAATGASGMSYPIGVAVDGTSRLWVVEFSNHRALLFNLNAPTMTVSGNDQVIADGDTTPDTTDATNFGSVPQGQLTTRTFTIANSGTADLTFGTPAVVIGGTHAGDFSVIQQPASPVAANNSTTFQVRFMPSAIGLRSATISIANNDSAKNPYNFSIQGSGVPSTAPVVTLSNDPLIYTENDPATIVDGGATVSDTDSANFSGGTLTASFSAGGTASDRLSIRNQGTGAGQIGVIGSTITYGGVAVGTFTGGTNGSIPLVVTFNASATPSATEALLRNLLFQNVSDAPTAARTVQVVISDGGGGTSTAATKTINITTVNDPPTANTDTITVDEDSGATVVGVLANDSFAPDTGETLSVTAVSQPANGTVTLTSGTVHFTPNANWNGSTSFTYTLSDGNGGTATGTVNVTVTPVDDAPVLTGSGAPVGYTENASGTPIDPSLTLTDVDGPNLTGMTIAIGSGFVSSQDLLEFTNQLGITGSYNTSSGILTLSGNASAADYQTALRTVTYRNLSDTPNTAPRQITFSVGQSSLYFAGTGHYYEYISSPLLHWSTAKSTAEAKRYYGLKGYLVTITSAPESLFVVGKLAGAQGWLGASDAAVEGQWRWVSGPEAGTQFWQGLGNGMPTPAGSYTNWNGGEPNNSGDEDYGQFVTSGGWNDLPNGILLGYVVEYGGMPGDPVLSLVSSTTVNVTAVNDPPMANTDSFTVAEDSAATVLNVLANDSTAPETGETLSVTAVTQPANGTVTFTSNTVSFTPNANWNGSTSFTYTLSDGNGGTATGTVNVTVTSVNDPPTANSDSLAVDEDSAATVVNVLANDGFAPDTNETLSVISVSQPANGTVTLSAGVVNFTPAPNFAGSTSFTYTLSDGQGGTAVGTVNITVAQVNDAPVAVDDGKGVNFTEDFSDNSAGWTLGTEWQIGSATASSGQSYGNADPALDYTPTGDNGIAGVVIGGNASTGLHDYYYLTSPVIDAAKPGDLSLEFYRWLNSDYANYMQNVVQVYNGSSWVIVWQTGGSPGVQDNAWQKQLFDITAHKNANLRVRFGFRIGSSGVYNVSSWNLDDVRVFSSGLAGYNLTEDETLTIPAPGVLTNDTDVEGNALTVIKVDEPSHGSVTLNADGSFTYTPEANYNGTDSFTYKANDGQADSNVATVNLTISEVNDAPTGTNDTLSDIDEDSGARTIPFDSLLDNDTKGPDNESAQFLTISAVSDATGGTVNIVGSNVIFTSAANYNGTASFTYTLQDNGTTNGASDPKTATATVTFNVTSVNDAPSFTRDPAVVEVDEDFATQQVVTVTSNPVPADEAEQTVTYSLLPESVSFANVAINPTTGEVTITAQPNANGTATFTITADDGQASNNTASQTFTLIVNSVNDTPAISSVDDQVTDEDTTTNAIDFTVNDVETAADSLNVTATSSNQTLVPDSNIVLSNNGGDYSVTISPASNQSGQVTIILTVSDGDKSATETFVLDVVSINDAPTITTVADQAIDEDTTTGSLDFTVGDVETAVADLTITATSSDEALVPNSNIALTNTGGKYSVAVTPASNQFGDVTITLTVSDGDKSTSETFLLTINAVNDLPSFTLNGDPAAVDEDAGAQFVEDFASSISAGPNEDTQVLTFEVTDNTNVALFATGGAPTIEEDGTLTYTPADDANGTATITVRLTDDGGTANGGIDTTSTQTFVITVNEVDDAPSFTLAAGPTVDEDTGAQTVADFATALSTGPSDESMQTLDGFSLVQTDTTGGLSFTGAPALALDGTLTYTPTPNTFGTATFEVTLSDSGRSTEPHANTSAPKAFTITVSPVSDTPSVTGAAALEDTQTTSGLVVTRNAADSAEVTHVQIASITGGTLYQNDGVTPIDNGDFITIAQAEAGLKFTPSTNSVLDGSFTVQASTSATSAGLAGGVVTTTITITPVNDAPSFTLAGDPADVDEDTGAQTVANFASNLSAGPSDENGQTLTFEVTDNTNPVLFAVGGAPTVSQDGTLSYTPASNAFGTAEITLVLKDTGGTENNGSDTSGEATFIITVNNINDVPTATFGGASTVNEGSATSVNFTGSADADPQDIDAGLRYSYDFANDGTFDLGDGTYNGGEASATAEIPAALLADGPGTITVRAWVIDQNNTYTEYTTDVAIANVAPLADAGGSYSGVEGDTIALSAAASTDPGNDTLTFAWDLDDDGSFDDATGAAASFAAKANGTYHVHVKVSDEDGGSTSATATITVGNVNPQVDAGASVALNEGETLNQTGAFTDPGSNSWTATVDYGDGTGEKALALNADKSFTLDHSYADNGTYNVTVRVSDGVNTGSATVLVQVAGVVPTATFGNSGAVNEGSTGIVSFSNVADPSSVDTAAGFTYSYDFDNDGTFEITGSKVMTATVPVSYLADGPQGRLVAARVTDKDGAFSDYTTTITVNNVAPVVSVGGPYQGDANRPIALQATATDAGNDALTYAWDLDGDGAFDDATGQNATFQPTRSGTYTVRVQVTDADGAQTTATATVEVATYRVFLPMMQIAPGQPDLVVESIGVKDGKLQVVVLNQGAAAVSNPFWVDMYINPTAVPTQVDQTWQLVGNRGLVWGVQGNALPLAPGARITLTVGDQFFSAADSNQGGTVAAGSVLYAQADSVSSGNAYGAVLESHEQDGSAYNNILKMTLPADVMAPLGVYSMPQAAFERALPARPE